MDQINNVQEFKDHWIKMGMPWRPPFKNPIHVTDIAYSLCVYRHKNFQVELYLCKPNTQSPLHSHPGVESISMYLTGHLEFFKPNEGYVDLSHLQRKKEDGTHILVGQISNVNNGKEPHALRVGDSGGAFLVFEDWADKEPTSVTLNWEGELVGDVHKKTIEDKNVENS